MITSLLKWAYAMDVELWCESGKLKYRATEGVLTDEMKQRFVDNKEAIIKRLQQNQAAKAAGWLTFDFGEAYNKRTGERSELFIFRNENETFALWRGSWRAAESKPNYERTIADRISFDEALSRANNSMQWSRNKYGRRKAG